MLRLSFGSRGAWLGFRNHKGDCEQGVRGLVISGARMLGYADGVFMQRPNSLRMNQVVSCLWYDILPLPRPPAELLRPPSLGVAQACSETSRDQTLAVPTRSYLVRSPN